MIPITTMAGRRVALFGLGGSGLSTARALIAGGAMVAAWDDNERARAAAAEQGVPLENLAQMDWSSCVALVLSPGAPLTHPAPHWSAERAHAAGVEIIGDIELFCRERARLAPRSPFVAVTGTNGKSTTSALIAHIMQSAGVDAQLGGNIGTPILDLDPPEANRAHVIECSSFQIDLAPSLDPTVAVLTNISPDHLDRHGSMEHYASVKERLTRGADVALVSVDDEWSWRIGQHRSERLALPGRGVLPVSVRRELDWGFYLDGSKIVSRRPAASPIVLADLAGISTLRGRHNAQNAAFAAAALDMWKFEPGATQRGIETFPGLAHRMEIVGRIGRVLFVNDSKATNADAAEKALLSFDDVFWIIGGRAKEGGIEPLRPLFSKVRKAYCMGEAAESFARTLGDEVPHEIDGALDQALASSARDAAQCEGAEPVVLLSPACASYDQFTNFEARGDAFRDLVHALIGHSTDGSRA
ncbi:MAG TPA: UDP-N-acetylmuramoyl-L-alanine--D-glutamate ligase [Beijerinckiaceae bacterium]|nr:UDP-N-acetylmuramoyl-L-alanine--D-glutamate ligase [Beijerinckiaceae bacterium]